MTKLENIVGFLLSKQNGFLAVRLHRFLYICLVKYFKETKKLLFDDEIEVWQFGPIIKSLHENHREKAKFYASDNIGGGALDNSEIEFIMKVFRECGWAHLDELNEICSNDSFFLAAKENNNKIVEIK